jgi:predicted secreted protein
MTVLTGADEGSTRVLEPGERLTVRLPENAGTGFLWTFDVPRGLEQTDDRLLPPPPGSGIGGSGLHEFDFTVSAPVDGPLRARLVQPWEPDAVAETWEVLLTAPG